MKEDSFYSLDHLVEFGLGISVANQMIKAMNESMQNMYVPGADNRISRPETMYYAIIDGHQAGPFSECEVARLIADKKIVVSTYMWRPGMPNWKQVSEMPDVLKIVALTPPNFNK